jgi:23S rRNA (cytidine2498-2'-O)-methyltransferase
LGAAPGGWTSVLLEYGIQVTAVDTGDMDSRLLKNKNLKVQKQNVADLKLDEESFDLITSDMSWSPSNTANMVKGAAVFLKKGGLVVVTVKLMGSKVGKTIKEVKSIYHDQFEILATKQLFHNRDEVTLFMKKK